ncbi:MAG TPA: hypothetical protein ENJ82_07985 [Bacteroidetes bacterium]|nr:hypothetical protein [Bacteroidota bacterium]
MTWIYSYDRGVNPLPGYTEIMGLFTIPVAIAAIILVLLGHRWAPRSGQVGVGIGLMAIFRIWTGTTITMTDLSIAYGVYLMIAASAGLAIVTWSWRKPLFE